MIFMLANVRHVIKVAPTSNWFMKMDENFKKVNLRTDSDIYDMFLHKRDISYAVLDLYNWVQKSGLKITYFCNEDWQLTYYNNYHYNYIHISLFIYFCVFVCA